MGNLKAHWVGEGRAASCPADPAHPGGVSVNTSTPGAPSCRVRLRYPAPECGKWVVTCRECGLRVVLTAAGRADDPRSLKVACIDRGRVH